jgi:hypothetical protein
MHVGTFEELAQDFDLLWHGKGAELHVEEQERPVLLG